MERTPFPVLYPRKRFERGLARSLGRLVLPRFFRIQVRGRENFPPGGPLIVVGNHAAVMEVVLMIVYTPWQVEVLGGGDVPHEAITEIVSRFYGYIPYNRGHMDRLALKKALSVLEQGGVLGVFPEGGIWQTNERRARPGVAWLSEKAQAPVLPIYYGTTRGALKQALRLKRPTLTMKVGKLIPPARLAEGQDRKIALQNYASQVLAAINALAPPDALARTTHITDERFSLEASAFTIDGEAVTIPSDVIIQHAAKLAKLLHYPAILKIFRQNLRLPIEALQSLSQEPPPEAIARACDAMLGYLERENAYPLTYRFGPREAEAMQKGLVELRSLAHWAMASGLRLKITPTRNYYNPEQDEHMVQTEQGVFEDWM